MTVRRVVSLVPSLTEAMAVTAPGLVVGATDWCTHPAGLEVERIGGTKNPDVERIVALRPDLVVANEEENRAADLGALRAAGIPVWVTEIRTVEQAFRSLDQMLTEACGVARPEWLDAAESAWEDVRRADLGGAARCGGMDGLARRGRMDGPARRAGLGETVRRAVVPIWRRPWMVLGRDTFAGDVLRRLGVSNVYAEHAERYPKIPLEELQAQRPDLVVLPDEPYAFGASDGPEAFPGVPAALVSGRHLTWYGPSLVEAPSVLLRQLAVTC